MFILFQGCKKDIPEPDVVKIQVYNTTIKYTNYNEPNVLNWYVRSAEKGGYFFCYTTTNVTDFTDYIFQYSLTFPSALDGKRVVRDIVVKINQLNGDMYFDIMKREKIKSSTNSLNDIPKEETLIL